MRLTGMIVGLAMAAGLAGCATRGVYFHSPALATQADAADAAVRATDSVKTFDDQIANLTAVGAKLDLGIARQQVARRDLDLAGVVDLASPDAARARLDATICARLGAILGDNLCADPQLARRLPGLATFAVNYVAKAQLVRDAQVDVDSARVAYRLSLAKDEKSADDSCDALAGGPASGSGQKLRALAERCQWLSDSRAAEAAVIEKAFPGTDGAPSAIGGDLLATIKAGAPKASKPSPNQLGALQAEIKAAKAAAESGNAVAIDKLREDIASVLGDASDEARTWGWKQAEDELGGLLQGAACAGGDEKKAAAAGVDCKSIVATATSGRTEAVFNLLSALGAVADLKDPRRRSAPWMAAATAMASASAADADLQAAAGKTARELKQTKALLLAKEASRLAKALTILRQGEVAMDSAGRLRRALPVYADSWNAGRIPESLLDEQGLRAFRLAAIRRVQNGAVRQRGLILAASESVKAYADGGLDPTVLVQLMATLGLIGVAAGK